MQYGENNMRQIPYHEEYNSNLVPCFLIYAYIF